MQTTIITGPTGCGKTTQVPTFILEDAAAKRKYANIIVTQPRRIAAQSVARRVCEEKGWELGGLVGYKVGMDKEHWSQDTRLTYCTTGVLKKMIIGTKSINDFTHVILDEVHEREEDMDFVMLLCKMFLQSNSSGTKLILMSATINVGDYEEYFALPVQGRSDLAIPAEVISLETRQPFPVPEFFTGDLNKMANYSPLEPPDLTEGPKLYDQNVFLCDKLLRSFDKAEQDLGPDQPRGTALVFLPGEHEIHTVKRRLVMNADAHQWDILLLYSRVPFEDIRAVFHKPAPGRRKIILATNIAESSITIPDVEFVIDFCLTKYLTIDSITNFVSLKMNWADKQSLRQRKGRAGRVKAGRVYRLITKDFFNCFIPDCHPPEILRAPLDKLILDTKILDMGPPKQLLAQAMSPPDLTNITNTVMSLKETGALLRTVNGTETKHDGNITALGKILAGLPVDIRLGKLIILGHLLDVLDECVIIAACLSNKSIFAMPVEQLDQAYGSKLDWAKFTFSDSLAVLYAFQKYQALKTQGYFERAVPDRERRSLVKEWCRRHFLQYRVLQDVELAIEDIQRALKRQFISSFVTPNRPELSESDKVLFIHVAVFGAFYPNYFLAGRKARDQDDLKQINKLLWGADPSSCVYLTRFPDEHSQFGVLYKQQIKELFKGVCDPSLIMVNFASNRVVVKFPKERQGRGSDNISPFVFMAMKMKDGHQFKRGLPLELHSLEKAKELVKLVKERLDMESSKTEQQMEEVLCFDDIDRIAPPDLTVRELPLEVVHVDNPSSFWIQSLQQEHQAQLQRLDDAITLVRQDNLLQTASAQRVVRGGLYLAPYEGDLFRARADR